MLKLATEIKKIFIKLNLESSRFLGAVPKLLELPVRLEVDCKISYYLNNFNYITNAEGIIPTPSPNRIIYNLWKSLSIKFPTTEIITFFMTDFSSSILGIFFFSFFLGISKDAQYSESGFCIQEFFLCDFKFLRHDRFCNSPLL